MLRNLPNNYTRPCFVFVCVTGQWPLRTTAPTKARTQGTWHVKVQIGDLSPFVHARLLLPCCLFFVGEKYYALKKYWNLNISCLKRDIWTKSPFLLGIQHLSFQELIMLRWDVNHFILFSVSDKSMTGFHFMSPQAFVQQPMSASWVVAQYLWYHPNSWLCCLLETTTCWLLSCNLWKVYANSFAGWPWVSWESWQF